MAKNAGPLPPVRLKSRRGFAMQSPERRREIARKGGQSVQPADRAFSRDRELAARAGAAGGSAVRHYKPHPGFPPDDE